MGHRIQNHFLLKLQPIIYLNKLFKIPNLSLRKPPHGSVPPGPTTVPVMMSRRTWHFQGKPPCLPGLTSRGHCARSNSDINKMTIDYVVWSLFIDVASC
jgi:hypothetical protein